MQDMQIAADTTYRVDPDLLPHFSSDMTEALDSIYASGLQTPISQHTQHLGIFCAGSATFTCKATYADTTSPQAQVKLTGAPSELMIGKHAGELKWRQTVTGIRPGIDLVRPP